MPEYSNSHATAQETNMFHNFTAQIRSGSLSASWPDLALQTQQVMNACFQSAREDSRPVEVD